MAVRTLTCVAMLAAVAITGSVLPGAVRADEVSAASTSGGTSIHTRFRTRIRAMLKEAGRLERAGKTVEALRIADRASRMLDVIGGEAAWRGNTASPAEFVARMAERQRSAERVPVSSQGPGSRSQDFGHLQARSAQVRSAQALPATESSVRRSVFPDVPAQDHFWVPVGRAVPSTERWVPFGGQTDDLSAKPETLAGAVRLPGSDQPLPPWSAAHPVDQSTGTGNPPGLEESAAGEPHLLPGTEGQIPGRAATVESETGQPATEVSGGQDSGPVRRQQTTAQSDPTGLWHATLVGAIAGVCLLLAGWCVRVWSVSSARRDAGHSVTGSESETAAATTGAGVDRPSVTGATGRLPRLSADWSPGMLLSDVGACASQNSDSDAVAVSRDPSAAIVPLRVFGTRVVLGEAAVAEVDADLERRRQSVLQAVFDQNVALHDPTGENRVAKAA